MSGVPPTPGRRWSRPAAAVRRGLPLVVLALGLGASWLLLSTAPQQEQRQPPDEPPVVDVVPVAVETHEVRAEAFGTVLPARDVTLAPQVSGRLVEVAASLEPGGAVRAGELLARVDPADYELDVTRAEAELEQARADLEIERGRRLVAEREWERFGAELGILGEEADRARSRALALREPQLRRAEALVGVAENRLAMARLALERTALRAPFDAVVLDDSAEVGRYVAAGDPVVHLAGTGQFWVQASLSAGRAAAVESSPTRTVRVVRDAGFGAPEVREGRLLRVLPSLDTEGRMARVLVAVDDPLSLGEAAGLPRLPLESYVRVELSAGSLTDVVRVPREALRENEQVWLVDGEGRLRVRDVAVVWRGADEVFVRGELGAGERLVTSYLSDPLPGMELAVRGARAAEGEGAP